MSLPETQSQSERRGSTAEVRPLRIGVLSTWNTRCGIAEYTRHLVEALRRQGEVEVIVLGSRNFGERAIAPYEDWATPVFDVQIWHPEHSFELDVEAVLELGLDVLHIQYSNLFYDRSRLVELLHRFSGVTALTYHDKGGVLGFPHELPDLLYAHREDIGVGPRRLIPQGVDLRRAVVKTFGLGRSRLDVIEAVCERGGWDFQHSFGEDRWLESDELFQWLRDSDAIVLWYDEDLTSGGSAGAPLAIGTRRPVFVNDTEWFRDLPEQTPNLRKLHSPEDLERALRELFSNPYAEARTWDRVAGMLLADYRMTRGRHRMDPVRRRDTLRQQAFVALDHKSLRRVLRRVGSELPAGLDRGPLASPLADKLREKTSPSSAGRAPSEAIEQTSEQPSNTENLRFDVLRTKDDVNAAMAQLRGRGWVKFGSPLQYTRAAAGIRRLLGRYSLAPDPIKSWDVLRALEAIAATTPPELSVLDLGSVACPILPGLHELGFRDLHGIDLDPRVGAMPFAEEIDYRMADMTAAPWPDQTFAAITAISVIEHGFNQSALLDEVARLLRPGGAFIFSTDYWPEKIPTDGMRLFNLDWQIFSADEIEAFLAAAAERGLHPVGDPRAVLRAPMTNGGSGRPVSYEGRDYTFLYGALVRDER